MSELRLMVPLTSKITTLGTVASSAARKEPAPPVVQVGDAIHGWRGAAAVGRAGLHPESLTARHR